MLPLHLCVSAIVATAMVHFLSSTEIFLRVKQTTNICSGQTHEFPSK